MHSLAMIGASIAQEIVNGDVDQILSGQDGIIFALIGMVGTSIAALVYTIRNNRIAKDGVDQISQVNNAVNNIGPGEHRLYDMISLIRSDIEYLTNEQRNFAAKGWNSLPEDINTAVGLTSVIRDLQHAEKEVINKLQVIQDTLIEHTEWEMQQKYIEPNSASPPPNPKGK